MNDYAGLQLVYNLLKPKITYNNQRNEKMN